MQNLKHIIFIVVLILSQNIFGSGFSGLKLFYGTKAASLGENLCSLPEDIETVYYNPAGLVGLSAFEVKAMYLKWIAEINRADFMIAKSFADKSSIVLSFNYLWTQLESESVLFNYLNLIADIAYAKKLGKVYFGIGATSIYETTSLDESSNLAGGLNLGLLLRKQRLSFGLGMRNFGISFVSMGEEKEMMPSNVNCGISYIMSNHILLTFNLKYTLDGIFSTHTGIELPLYKGIKEEITVRIGNVYKINSYSDLSILSNFRVGAGFRKEGLKFDYTVIPLGEIGFYHYVALGFMFY